MQITQFSIREILVKPKLIEKARELLFGIDLMRGKLIVISDENTYEVAGRTIKERLKSDSFILPGNAKADLDNIEAIRTVIKGYDAVVAVGSGSISDLCKYASYLESIPYAVFATAPSMNGYASITASIINGDKKKSHMAHLPKGIYFDMNIIADAPIRLIKSGFGDLMCRSTAQSDWLVSHYLLDTDYTQKPFEWLLPLEKKLIKKANLIPKRDPKTLELLCEALIVSGLGMTLCTGSYPASQGEHMIAHYMENHNPNDSFHGEQIAVTTSVMAELQENILNINPEIKKSYPEGSMKYSLEKSINLKNWQKARDHIEKIRINSNDIRAILSLADVSTDPLSIGWDQNQLKEAIKKTPLTRDRFTFLDLAYLSGNL